MKRATVSRQIVNMTALAALAATLGGCESFRDAAGISKQSPDEFAITTKAPLVIPPDYNLRPPKPGAAPANQTSPEADAQGTLFNNAQAAPATASNGTFSQGEQQLLANAGAANADNNIRRQVNNDDSNAASDEGFSDQVLFWQGNNGTDTSAPVNADAEAQRIQNQQTNTQNPGMQGPPQQPQTQQDLPSKKNDSGWLGGLFDW